MLIIGVPEIDEETRLIREERARLIAAQDALEARTRAVVQQLRPTIVVRRVADMLAISPARVSQIEHDVRGSA